MLLPQHADELKVAIKTLCPGAQGYNGSQLWDTAFAVQALGATQLGDHLGDSLKRAASFIEASQVRFLTHILFPVVYGPVRTEVCRFNCQLNQRKHGGCGPARDRRFSYCRRIQADCITYCWEGFLRWVHKGVSLPMCTVQAREDVPGPLNKWYRHISKGAWPFSTRDHGWPISDCTSEGALLINCSNMLQTPGRMLCADICTALRAILKLRHVCRQHGSCCLRKMLRCFPSIVANAGTPPGFHMQVSKRRLCFQRSRGRSATEQLVWPSFTDVLDSRNLILQILYQQA